MSIMIQFLRKFNNDEDLEHNSLKPIYYCIAGFFYEVKILAKFAYKLAL